MFAEKHQDLSYLEQEFRRSLKYYRSLLRWGVDKVFCDAGLITEGLFNDVRQYLDKNNVDQAGATLVDLDSRLREMEQSYPQVKNDLLVSIKDLICSLENTLSQNLIITSSDSDYSLSFDEMLKDLECARVSLQNDDWEHAKLLADRVFKDYLDIRQEELINDQYTSLEEVELAEVQQKIRTAFQSGLACRLLPSDDLDNMFQMAEARSIATLRIGVFASEVVISKLFTELSKKIIAFEDVNSSDQGYAALLRIPVSRTMTIYIVGIPVMQCHNIAQIRNLASQYSMLFLEAGQAADVDIKSHELLLACIERLPAECINIVGKTSTENALNQLASMESLNLEELNLGFVVDRIHETVNKSLIYR